MRISGGRARGIPLVVPKGEAVRPATDGLRQSVFSSLGERVAGARFLDLFAGSGAYGLEALSRGSAGGTFVEKNARAAACLRQNIAQVCKSLGCGPEVVSVTEADVLSVISVQAAPDLVFIDPPYELISELGPGVLEALAGIGNSDPLVIFEMPGGVEVEAQGWSCVKRLGRGLRQPTAAFFRRIRSGP